VANYRPETCAYCQADTWCEIRANGKPQCRACKVERFFSEVLYPPLAYRLLPWQRKVIRDLYGTVLPEDGSRRYRHGYISVAKQNGKSFLFGGLPIYHLLMEDELNPEAYGCAAAKDQAGIIFKAAARLINANSDLRWRFKLLESSKRIVRWDGGGSYAVLSADGDVQDGIRPSLLLRDEVHRWKTLRAETLYDVVTKGQISRDQPLDLGISTAGAEYESPLWFREYEYSKHVLDGSLTADSYYAAIYEADVKRIDSDPEYWKSREARVAANPSHEDLGGFLKDAAIVGELEKALTQPSQRSKYLRYHLNVPTMAQEDPIIEMPKWLQCGGGEDLREWPTYDFELLLRKWNLIEKPCWAGVDASWTTDLTAVVFVFPPFDQDRHGPGSAAWTLLPFFWLPDGQIPKLERICRVPLSAWVRQKFVETTPGEIIDQRAVMDHIRWGRQMFDLQEVPYDRCNFRSEAMNLVDDGIQAVEVNQTFMSLSYATKFLLGAYVAGNLRHGNHPVLNWMASCLQLQYDHKDNCQPSKPERLRSSKRIDGIQATVTALVRATVAEDTSNNYTIIRSVG
jgi:phage terminase large subunit-like protein